MNDCFIPLESRSEATKKDVAKLAREKRAYLKKRSEVIESAFAKSTLEAVAIAIDDIRKGAYLCQYYDSNWEDDVVIDPSIHRHVSADMLVYDAEHLVMIMEEVESKSKKGNPFSTKVSAKEQVDMWRQITESDWFTSRITIPAPRLCFMDFTKFNRVDFSGSIAVTLERANLIAVNHMTPDWGLFFTLVHELVHLIVRAPYGAHGRLFRYTHLWLWSHLDEIYGTNITRKLIICYENNGLEYRPKSWYEP